MEIRVVDNFLSDDDFNKVLVYCKDASYSYGEVDGVEDSNDDTFCIGMIHQLFPDSTEKQREIVEIFRIECEKQFPEIKEYKASRMYINCFASSENPYFHIDSFFPDLKSYTCLFYANDRWKIDDGGETQFYVNNILYGVPPEPNRMVLFDGRIQHRATSFRNRHRFTIAIKYDIPNDCDAP